MGTIGHEPYRMAQFRGKPSTSFEVLAIADNGNETITQGSFVTAP